MRRHAPSIGGGSRIQTGVKPLHVERGTGRHGWTQRLFTFTSVQVQVQVRVRVRTSLHLLSRQRAINNAHAQATPHHQVCTSKSKGEELESSTCIG